MIYLYSAISGSSLQQDATSSVRLDAMENSAARLIERAFGFFATVYIAAGFGLLLSVADNSLRKSGVLPVPPTIFAMCFVSSILCFVFLLDLLRKRSDLPTLYLIQSNASIIIPFAILAFLSLGFALNPTAYWGDGRKWIYLVVYDFFIFLGASLLPAIALVRKRIRFFVLIGLITILFSIFYEIQNPGTYSSVPGRAAGFPGNSNWGALVTVMICSMSLSYKDGLSRIGDFILLAASGTGIYFTLSRSGMINFVFLILFYAVIAILASREREKTFLQLVGALAVLLLFFGAVIPFLSENSALTSGSRAENRVLALLEGEISDDGSAADRLEAARETLDMIERSPLFGNGTGFNRRLRQTPHNLYLKLWVDSGIFGVMAWVLLLACSFWVFTVRRYRQGQALIIATLFGGFFSHNILEQRTFLILLGVGAAMSLYESSSEIGFGSAKRRSSGHRQTERLNKKAEPQTLEKTVYC